MVILSFCELLLILCNLLMEKKRGVENLKKSYTALSRKLGGKYYFDNSSKNKIIIKKVYYLEGQKVKAKVTFKDKDVKEYVNIRFDDLVRRKKSISKVEIGAINGKILPQSIQLSGSSL